tara:strand:- start:117 stop:737 length:621 start_codon:yes stop_codon:yes gene_type:complete
MDSFNPEYLREIGKMNTADPRWEGFGHLDQTGQFNPITIEEYAQPIIDLKLNSNVPEKVVIHFETAKNLALFAWNVYRFTPVAELYAFISIEFALREKTGDRKKPFSSLFKQAVTKGWLSNERFSQWKNITEQRESNYQLDIMIAEDAEFPLPPKPEYWDYLEVLGKYITHFRNSYAHGSSSLAPFAYKALRDSAEIINQIYEYSE